MIAAGVEYLPIALCGVAFVVLASSPGQGSAAGVVAFALIAAAFGLIMAGVSGIPS